MHTFQKSLEQVKEEERLLHMVLKLANKKRGGGLTFLAAFPSSDLLGFMKMKTSEGSNCSKCVVL